MTQKIWQAKKWGSPEKGMFKIPFYLSEMLPSVYQRPYQQLQQDIEELQKTLVSATDATRLKLAIAALQTFFQTEVWNLDLQPLEPELQHRVQSINVEIDKQLRLLNMDVLFLQAARQENTIQQRQQQVRDRLALLLQYCNSLFAEQ